MAKTPSFPRVADEYDRLNEERFRRQLEQSVSQIFDAISLAYFGSTPWVPKMSVLVDYGGTFDGLDVVEAGATVTKYKFTFTSSDDSIYPLTQVSDLSDGTKISFDPGAVPFRDCFYTPSVGEAAPKTFFAKLKSNSLSYIVQAKIYEGFRVFYGNSSNTSLAEAQIEALSGNVIDTSFQGRWDFTAGTAEYRWFCYPKEWGAAATIVDASDGSTVAFEDPIEVSVTNAFSDTTTYYAYRSTATFSASITLAII